MNPERLTEIRDLFEHALDMPPTERRLWLAQAAGDEDLRGEVLRLLEAHEVETAFFDKPGLGIAPPPPPNLEGQLVGAWRIEEPIGQGGMGAVYRATRADGAYAQAVAVKVLGFAPAHLRLEEAFRQERQILARLDHPNIARLLDGGATPEGLLYLVMELVSGSRIDRHCEQNNLAVRERIRLFREVCAAVQYAHRNLIVHRDLKPSNIMVTTEGQVKLLDFGIAKVLGDSHGLAPADRTITFGARMTPDYASPEQVLGRPVATASDVYSLGVILYELLTSQRPYRTAAGATHEIMQAVVEQEPARPSSLAGRPLRGDLDTIVLKALAKQPERRYASVEQFDADLRRWLEGRPVLARGDSLAYRLRKNARRNWLELSAAAAIAATIATGVVSTLREARIAAHERVRAEAGEQAARVQQRIAEQREAEAERHRILAERRYADVRSLATTVLFDVHDSIRGLAGAAKARRLTVEKALGYLEALSRESEGDLALQSELAGAYERAGDILGNLSDSALEGGRAAAPQYEKAIALRRQVAAARPGNREATQALASAELGLGSAKLSEGDTQAAIRIFRRALQSDPRPAIHNHLCAAYTQAGDLPSARAHGKMAVEGLERLAQPNPAYLAEAYANHGEALRLSGQSIDAVTSFRRALAIPSSNDPPLRRAQCAARLHLADTLQTLNDRTAQAAYGEAVAALKSTLALDPGEYRVLSNLAAALERHATLLERDGLATQAESAMEEALRYHRQLAERPKAGALERSNFALALAKCGFPRLRNPRLALEMAAKANELTKERNPRMLNALAWAYYANGLAPSAIETCSRALASLPVQPQGPALGLRSELEGSLRQFQSGGHRR